MEEESEAITEGRRIYLGNLLYAVPPTEIGEMLNEHGFGAFEHIHVSVDPVTGRNPGYCFIDFETAVTAAEALDGLKGQPIRGRPVKTGPCRPKRGPTGRFAAMNGSGHKPLFNRWGDWNGDEVGAPISGQGPYGAEERLAKAQEADWRKRLYVGGLRKMVDQVQNDIEIREIFEGFDIAALSKRITPHDSTRSMTGNHHYCFVDFHSTADALRAVDALDGKEHRGDHLRVSMAKRPPRDIAERTPDRMERDRMSKWRGTQVDSYGPAREDVKDASKCY